MSLTTSVFRIHSLLFKIIPIPYTVLNHRLEINQSFKNKYFRIFHTFCLTFSFVIILPICLFRLVWLISHWKSYTCNNVDQLLMFATLTSIKLILAPILLMFKNHCVEIIYMIYQVCQLEFNRTNYQTNQNTTFVFPIAGRRTIRELIIFSVAAPFVILSPTFLVAPFTLPYLPLQLIFGHSIYVKVVSSILYGYTGPNIVFSILSAILIAIAFLENIIYYSSEICSKTSNVYSKWYFVVCVNRFKRAQLLIELGNIIYSKFLTVLIFVGIILASSGSYMTIKMYKRVNLIVYLSSPATSIICFTIALILTYLANIPFENSKMFRKKWIPHLTRREHRKMLVACKPFGFNLGPYGIGVAKLGLCICDDIVRNTVNIILLDSL